MKYFLSFLVLCLSLSASAQKFAYVDIEYIMNHIPEYSSAQTQLDETAELWQNEIIKMEMELTDMKNAYANEEVLYTKEVKERKWKEIENKEVEIYKYKQSKFGYEGELFLKRQELIKPIQDNIFAEIEKLATDKRYDFIFDKSATPMMLFAKEDYDKSNLIIKALGYRP